MLNEERTAWEPNQPLQTATSLFGLDNFRAVQDEVIKMALTMEMRLRPQIPLQRQLGSLLARSTSRISDMEQKCSLNGAIRGAHFLEPGRCFTSDARVFADC